MRPVRTIGRRVAALTAIVAMVATSAIVSVAVAPAAAAAPSPLQDSGPERATADALPTVQIDGIVWSQAIAANGVVWAGGSFANARPAGAAVGTNQTPRSNLLAYNIETGNLINFATNPSVNGQILAIAASPDGSRIYIAGEFTTVNGVTRNRVAAINSQTGALITNFVPNIGSRVKAIVATNDTVYVGGQFTSANGQVRTRLAAYQASNGALTSWAPEADYNVNALTLTPDKTKVIVGGAFQNISGQPAYGLASLDAVTGAMLPFAAVNSVRNAGANAAIVSLSADDSAIYGTGYVFGAGGNLEGAFSANPDTGDINWIEDCHGDTYGAYPSLNGLYTVSHAHYCGNIGGFPQTDPWATNMRFALAFSKEATGTIGKDPHGYFNWEGNPSPSMIQWYPDFTAGTASGQGQAGWTVTGNANYILVGGEFTRVNNVGQQGIVRFATKAKATNKSGPVLTGSKMIPSLVSLEPLKVRVAWQANWDRDDRKLNYRVVRNSVTQVYPAAGQTAVVESNFWDRPNMGFVDTVPTAGEYRYRVFAYDDDGNQVGGDTVYITVSDTGTAPSAFANLIKSQGVGTYWRLSEAGGTAAYDWAGWVDGLVGPNVTRSAEGAVIGDADTATTFNGAADSYVSSPNAINGLDTYTTAAWFKTTTTVGGKIIGFGNSQTGNSSSYDRHVYMDNAGRILFGVYNGAVRTLVSAKSYNDGQWHQVVSSLGPNGMVLYVDGVRVGVRSDVVNGQAYSGYWRVGGDNLGSWTNRPTSQYFNGSIDEVAIFPTVLTGQQVLDQYLASGRPSPIPSAPADAYGAAVYNDGPTLYWRLGEGTGATQAADSGTQFNTGTYRGTTTKNVAGALSGVANTAVTFNGSNGLVSSDYQFNNPTVYSTEAWFKTNTTRGGKIIGFGSAQSGTSGNYDRHIYMQNNGQLVFGAHNGAEVKITSAAAYRDNQWHHVVGTQGADGMKLYVDGQLVGSNPNTVAQNYVGYWRVGGDATWGSTSAYLAGTIDDAAVYPSVLSAQQVSNHYSLGKTGALPNQTPIAAFTKTTDFLALSVDGSTSSDPDGSVASYAWTFGDGGTATGATANHTYASAGTYNVTLTVTDNQGATGSSTQQVTVTANQNPTAAFTDTKNFLALSVDGSTSSDADGTVASYAWTFGDGGTATGATANHTYADAGTYDVTLTVTDNKGATGSTTRSVTVTAPPPNQPPTAVFTSGSTGLTLNVDGSTSSDTDGTIASYAWTFGDGGTATTAVANHTYAAGGTYSVTLTVTDNKGATGSTTQSITVTAPPPNQPPTAAFDITSVNGLTVNVDATASSDVDGSIQTYAWDFGDGGTSTDQTAVHTYATAGTKSIKLTVTDDDGAATSLTKTVTVTAPPPTNVSPTADFTVTKSDLKVDLNGSSSSDPDGTIASYSWEFGDGEGDTGVTASHTYLAAGTYSVTLTVTDNQGATNAKTQSVTVTAPQTPSAFATDAFTRTVTNGLGSAQVGGAWSLQGSASLFSVGAGTGNFRINTAGSGPLAFLNTVSASDLRGSVDFTYDKAMTGGGTYTSAIVRRVGTSDYRYKVRIQPTSVQLSIVKVVNGVETTIGNGNVNIAGLTWAPGDTLRLAFQAQGSGTTTLSGKIWKVGATEPTAWQVVRTDTQAELQGPGAVGLQAYLTGSATNAPVVASFDNLSIGTIPAP